MKIEAAQRLVATKMMIAERLYEYIDRLKKLGLKHVVSGLYANVFQHPTMPNVVVKILTGTDLGYEAYIKFSQKNANKYMPKILQVVEADKAFDGDETEFRDLRLVFMEKLTPMKRRDYMQFGTYLFLTAGRSDEIKELNSPEYVNMGLNITEVWEDLAKQKKDRDIALVAKFIVKTVGGKIRLDLHSKNIMMRGEDPIITDPFSS